MTGRRVTTLFKRPAGFGSLIAGRRRDVAEALLSGMVLQFLLLISGVIAARLLGPHDRGLLALIWAVALTVVQLGCLGMPLAVTYELARGDVSVLSMVRLLRRGVLFQVAGLTAVLAVILAALAEWKGLPGAPAAIALTVLPAMVLQSYCLAAIQGAGEFRSLQFFRLLPVGIYVAGLAIGAAAGESSLMFVTTVWVASYLFSAALTVLAVRRLAGSGVSAAPARTPSRRAMLRFGSAGLFGYVSPTETFKVDQLVVGLVLSVHDLGLYVAALAFCNLPRFLAQALGLVSYPAIASAPSHAARRRLLWKFVALGTAAALLVAVPLLTLARPLLNLAFGHAFVAAATTTQILLAGTVMLCVRRLLADGLRGAGAPGAGSLAEVLSWFWLIPALALLVPRYGLTGVALALASSYVATTIILLVEAERRGLGLIRTSSRPSRDGVASDLR